MKIQPISDYKELYLLWVNNGIRVDSMGSLREKGYEDYFNSNSDFFFGVFVNQKLIGACVLFHDGRKTGIYRLCVDFKFRKRGVATTLLQHCDKIVKSKGYRSIYALIERSNNESVNLFKLNGYTKYEEVDYFVKNL